MVPVIVIFSVVAAGIVLAMYRPLILSSISSDLATAQGVRVRLVGIGYLVALALAVSLSAVTIGAILSTALLIGPAATALRITNRPGRAALIAAVIGVARDLARRAACLRQLLLVSERRAAGRSASSSSR